MTSRKVRTAVCVSSNGCCFVAETLSEEDDDITLSDHQGISSSAMPELVSDFVPSPGGPFSALTSSMWPQDILHRLSNSVCLQLVIFVNIVGAFLFAVNTAETKLFIKFVLTVCRVLNMLIFFFGA